MSQGHVSLTGEHPSWSSATGSATASWNLYGSANVPLENGPPSSSGYHYDKQRATTATGDAHSGGSFASHASTSSSLGAAKVTQEYASYAPYSTSSQTYMYSNTEYQNYYNYQQPATSSSSQQVGACQNSGAPYQSFSSFQHTGSYVAPSYSSTYYNAGDHQTTTGYQSNNYVNQSNYWNDGSTANYPPPPPPPPQYSNYTPPVANSAQVTSNSAANSQNYQQYGQWPPYYYYSQPAPAVSPGPGTENMFNANASPACSVQAANAGYSYPSSQPPPPGTTSWRKESGLSVPPFPQV